MWKEIQKWLYTILTAIAGSVIGGLAVYVNHITDRAAIILITSATIAVFMTATFLLDKLTTWLFYSRRGEVSECSDVEHNQEDHIPSAVSSEAPR
jgi:hypothetical protein